MGQRLELRVRGVYSYINKSRGEPEKVAEEVIRVQYEMFAPFVPSKLGQRLCTHSSRQGGCHSINIDRFDGLSEWKV